MYDWLGGNNKAIGFLRVSSHRQKDNTSHSTQESELRAYSAEAGLELIEIFPIIESAKKAEERKLYQQAHAFALKNGIRHLLFYMTDRETRNLTDNEKNEDLVREDRIVLHYVKDRKVIHKNSTDGDFFQRDMMAMMNKHFIRNLRTKSMDGTKKKAEEGWFPSNHLPLGYAHTLSRDHNGKPTKRGKYIAPDSDERAIRQVQREFELRGIEGKTLEQIRQQIVAEGFIPPERVSQYRINTIQKRLTNQFYSGKFEWQGEVYQGQHELIIQPKLFQRVQETFGNRGVRSRKIGIFGSGWLKCSECGCVITYDPKKKTIKTTGEVREYPYYRCSNGRGVHKSFRGMNVTEENIWKQLEPALDEITISQSFAEQVAKALNETNERARVASVRERDQYKAKIAELVVEEDELLHFLKTNKVSEVQFDRVRSQIKEQMDYFTDQFTAAQSKINTAVIETAQTVIELCMDAKSLWKQRSDGERLEFLEDILSNRWLDGSSVRYELKKPFGVLSEMAQKEDWRPLRDSNSCLLREREPS